MYVCMCGCTHLWTYLIILLVINNEIKCRLLLKSCSDNTKYTTAYTKLRYHFISGNRNSPQKLNLKTILIVTIR